MDMPQLAPAFLVAIAGEGGAALIMTAIAKTVIAVGLSTAYTKYQQRQLKQNQKAGPKEVIIRDTTQPQLVVYGETYVGGVIAYMNTVHPGVNQGHELHMAVLVAGHEIEDVTDIYLDDTLLASGGALDWTANAVVSGTYDPDSRTDCEAVKVWKHLGTSTQTVDLELNTHYATDWTSDYRLRGLAYLVFRFKLTTKSETLWAGGPPQSIRIKVKGKKCYDPRTGTTVWTSNPVLCAADYMTSFMGVASARMDWDWIGAQADICDTLVDIPGPSTEKRYTCNGAVSLGDKHGKNIGDILSSCMGRLAKVNGKWRITAGAYEFPSVSLSDADIVGPIVMSTSLQRSERFNTVRGVFGMDPSNKHREMEFRQVTSSTYVARDNGETIVRSLSLPMTAGEYMAQRIAYKTLHQGDQQTTVTLPVRWTGLRVAVGSGVSLTIAKFGWTSKAFRCIGWKMGGGEAPFELVLREDNSAAWSDPAIGDYTTVSASGAVTLPTEDVAKDNPVIPLVNHLPAAFGDFEQASVDQFSITASSGSTISIATDRYWVGTRSLKVSFPSGTSAALTLQLSKYTTTSYNLKLPPDRRFLVVLAINCDNADAQGDIYCRLTYNGPGGSGLLDSSTIDLSTATTADAWARIAFEIDASGVEATQAFLTIFWSGPTPSATTAFWLDGVELLDVTDFPSITEANFPTHWIPPTGSTSGAVGLEGGARILAGDGSPESVVSASPGSLYVANDDGTAYLKESGTGNTGWVQLATGSLSQAKVKSADTARTSGDTGTTLTDDPHLSGFDVLAGVEYALDAVIRVTTANDTPDFKYTFQFSQTPQAAAGMEIDHGGTGVTSGTVSGVTLTATNTRNSSGGSDYVLHIVGRVLGHATLDAVMDFQWAQNNSSASATTVKVGSIVRLTPTN